jgi:hypothetical protein
MAALVCGDSTEFRIDTRFYLRSDAGK